MQLLPLRHSLACIIVHARYSAPGDSLRSAPPTGALVDHWHTQPLLYVLTCDQVARHGVLLSQLQAVQNRVPARERSRTFPRVGPVGPCGRRKWQAVYQRTYTRNCREERMLADAAVLDGDTLRTVWGCYTSNGDKVRFVW